MENKSSVHEYKSNAENRSDFILGFAGWFLISTLFIFSCFGITLAFFSIGQEGTGNTNTIFAMPLFLNAFSLFLLFSRRRWRGWGMLSAILLNAVITVFANYLDTGSFSFGWFMNNPGFEVGYSGLLGMLSIPYWLTWFFS